MLDIDIYRPVPHEEMPMTMVEVGAYNCYPEGDNRVTDYRAGVVFSASVYLDYYQRDRCFYSDDPDLPDWVGLLLKEES